MVTLRAKLEKFALKCKLNVDETGLSFKLLSRRTYITESEAVKSVLGTEAMRSKDRVNSCVRANAAENKMPIAIVRKSMNLMCFRVFRPLV